MSKKKINSADKISITKFLSVDRHSMQLRGWDELDVLLISGDAYVDHPAFGVPLLGRVLEKAGYRVGVIAQPTWESIAAITVMGRPKLFVGISSGCLDSMLAHYTAFRKKRSDDPYAAGGRAGQRPNRALIVYANLVRQAFKGVPIIVGGIEASMRRLVHYDFWSNSLRRSILFDARADLLVYGMAEKALLEAANRLRNNEPMFAIPGTAVVVAKAKQQDWEEEISQEPGAEGKYKNLPELEQIKQEPSLLVKATLELEQQVHQGGYCLFQPQGRNGVLVFPPSAPLTQTEFDELYELPFTRSAHPCYKKSVPALRMLEGSLTAVRGCGGGCSFCSLSLHQGRRIQSRSVASLKREVVGLLQQTQAQKSIRDVGGPTANAWGSSCKIKAKNCKRSSCYAPGICKQLELKQQAYLELLRELRQLPGVENVRAASGLRHDLALNDFAFMQGLIKEFIGGQLKVAPEHCCSEVLARMRKSDFDCFERFSYLFTEISREAGKEQYLVPYLMSALPGCSLKDMRKLKHWFAAQGWRPQQVQCFVPTPGTLATAMYYAECDAEFNPIYVARSDRERLEQHAVIAPG